MRRAAAAATRVFAEGAAKVAAAAREDPMFEGVVARRKALAWHLLRRALAVATPTAAQMRLRDALLAAAPGAGRKFQAKMGRLLRGGGGDSRGDSPGESEGTREGDEGDAEGDDDDAFLRAARRATKHTANSAAAETSGPGPVRAGAFALVRDWTPCAVGDLPAHLRGDPDPARLDPGAALRLAIGKAAEAEASDEGVSGANDVKADLLWGDWPASGLPPAVVGFGLAVPGVNYAVGAPFVDPTRRRRGRRGGRDGRGVRPGRGRGERGRDGGWSATVQRRPAGDGRPGERTTSTRRRGGFRGGESFAFVDMDDDRETDELGDVEPAGEEVDMEKVREDEEEAAKARGREDGDVADDVADEWEHDEAPTEDGNEGEEEDGMAVRIGGVRVMLTEEDRDAVASGVECLM